MKELAYQRWVVRSARGYIVGHGYGIKLSHQTAVGIPDLLVSMSDFSPCLVECKWLGEVVESFRRKIALTNKQRFELVRFNCANEDTGWVLVGAKRRSGLYLHQLYRPTDTHAAHDHPAYVMTSTQKELIPLGVLFSRAGVRRL